MTPCEGLTQKESQISILVCEGLTNREIGKAVGTSEQVVKNHLRNAFDKLGVWSRLELAMYVANHGGKDCLGNLTTKGMRTPAIRQKLSIRPLNARPSKALYVDLLLVRRNDELRMLGCLK
jgi:DNA-binding CsgD family transcriptional regulator